MKDEDTHKLTRINLPDKVSGEVAEVILQILTEHHFMMATLNVGIHHADYDEQMDLAMTYQACVLDRLGYDKGTSTRFLASFINKIKGI